MSHDPALFKSFLTQPHFTGVLPPHRDFGEFFASGQGSKQRRTREEASQSAIQHMLNRD